MRKESRENERIELSDGRVIYNSRSNACALFVYKHENHDVFILAIKRGKAVKNSGKWSIPCGYLNYDETLEDCAFREFYEETGFDIDTDTVRRLTKLCRIEDEPNGKLQNITFNYTLHLHSDWTYPDKEIDELIKFDGDKPLIDTHDEVTDMKWISLFDFDKYEWAYNANNVIEQNFQKSYYANT